MVYFAWHRAIVMRKKWITLFIALGVCLTFTSENTTFFHCYAFAEDGLETAEGMHILVEDGRITLSLKDAGLTEVLQEISRQTGIKVIYKNPPIQKVTCQCKDRPLEKGLRKLLDGQNFLFAYSRKPGSSEAEAQYVITQLFLLEKPGAETGPAGPQPQGRASITRPPMVTAPPVLPPPPPPPPASPAILPPVAPTPPPPSPVPDFQQSGTPSEPQQELSPELINEILKQDPQAQQELIRALQETMKDYPEEVNNQLMHLLEQYLQQEGEQSAKMPELLEQLLNQIGQVPPAEGEVPSEGQAPPGVPPAPEAQE